MMCLLSALTIFVTAFSGCAKEETNSTKSDKKTESAVPEITFYRTDNPAIETDWARVRDSPVVK